MERNICWVRLIIRTDYGIWGALTRRLCYALLSCASYMIMDEEGLHEGLVSSTGQSSKVMAIASSHIKSHRFSKITLSLGQSIAHAQSCFQAKNPTHTVHADTPAASLTRCHVAGLEVFVEPFTRSNHQQSLGLHVYG